MKAAIAVSFLLATIPSGFVVWAQQQLPQPVLPVTGPAHEIQLGGSGSKSAPKVIYANTIWGGYYSIPGTGEEWIDHGIITATEDHDTVTYLRLGYATTGPSAEMRFRVYPGYTGFCGFRDRPAFDLTLEGLPGSTVPGVAVPGVVSVDLNGLGECFFLPEGSFGYSFSYADNVSGPLLSSGGFGNRDQFDWTPIGSPSCGSWFFGGIPNAWCGFYTELGAHDGQDTFSGGCGNGVSLEMSGATCPGSGLIFTIDGGNVGDLWALAVGTSIGAGLGGSIGGCPIDVLPIVPIVPMGTIGSQPLTFPAVVTLASGTTLGVQVITKNSSTGVWDSSNTEILIVP